MLLQLYVRGLRNVHRFSDSYIIFIPESNLATDASRLAKLIETDPDPKISQRFKVFRDKKNKALQTNTYQGHAQSREPKRNT